MKNTDVYSLLALGPFRREGVDIDWHNTVPDGHSKIKKAVEEHWQTIEGPHIYNGPLVRLDGFQVKNGELILDLSRTDYASLMYSNTFADRIVELLGSNCLSRALGISAVLVTADDQIVLFKRSRSVGEYPGFLDIPGGHIDVPAEDDQPDPFQSMVQELEEEIGLDAREVPLELLALVDVIEHKKPELIFVAKSCRPATQILDAAASAIDRNEWEELFFLPVADLQKFLADQKRNISPSAFAGLELYKNMKMR